MGRIKVNLDGWVFGFPPTCDSSQDALAGLIHRLLLHLRPVLVGLSPARLTRSVRCRCSLPYRVPTGPWSFLELFDFQRIPGILRSSRKDPGGPPWTWGKMGSGGF